METKEITFTRLQLTKPLSRTIFFGFALIFFAVRGATLGSYFLSNVGLIALNGALATRQNPLVPVPSSQYTVINRELAEERYFQEPVLETKNFLQTAVQLNPENQAAWRGLGFVWAADGAETEAIAAWQRGGDGATAFVQWGEQAIALGQHETARLWYQRAVQVASTWSVPWFFLGQVHETTGDWAQAITCYETAISLYQPGDAELFVSTVYYRLGMVHQWVQRPSDLTLALEAYETAVALDNFATIQEKADSYTRMGQIWQWRNENLNTQIERLETAVATDPSYTTPYVLLGYAYFLQNGDVQQAEDEINKALALFPSYPTAFWYLGEIYRQAGMPEKALAQYEHLLTLEPAHSLALQRLAELNQVSP